MKAKEYYRMNMGENLDALMNLDPSCLGINRAIYPGARDYEKGPLAMSCAQYLVDTVKPGDTVLIMCGFVLKNQKRAEMDGFTGALVMARALSKGLGAKPVIITPRESEEAVKHCAYAVGMHYVESVGLLRERDFSVTGYSISRDAREARAQAEQILKETNPGAVITMEVASANEKGVYHMAVGWDVTEIEAKMDELFFLAKERGIPTCSIGDCGNELGMGAIGPYIKEHVPGAGAGGCYCGCREGAASATAADHIIIAKTADWGCYALAAALAYLLENMRVMHDGEMQKELMKAASRNGLVTTDGSLTPAIDGYGIEINVMIVELMRACVREGLSSEEPLWVKKYVEAGILTE